MVLEWLVEAFRGRVATGTRPVGYMYYMYYIIVEKIIYFFE